MDNIEKSTYEFVKGLISKQIKQIEDYRGDNVGDIALGLFQNESFSKVILELFGSGYHKETKLEIGGEDKKSVLFTLNQIIEKINEKLQYKV